MAKYRITDNVSGKTLVISGDNPPTEQEAEELFTSSGIRNQVDTSKVKKGNAPLEALKGVANVTAPIAQFAMPDVIKYSQENLQKIGAGNIMPTAPTPQSVGASALGPLGELLLGTEEQKTKTKATAEAAATLQSVLGIAGAAQGVAKGVGTVAKGAMGAKSVSPIKIASFLRNEAADKAGKVTTSSLLKAGDEYVKINPLAKDTWEVFRPTITKDMPAKELLNRMSQVFGQAYSRGGAVKDTAQAELMNQLYQAGKGVLKEQAPEVAKYTSGMRQILTAPQNIQKLTWLLAKLGLAKGAL